MATVQVNAAAIPGAEDIDVGSGGGCSACDTFNGSAFLADGTYDLPIYVTGAGGLYANTLAAKILRNPTIPGTLNGGAPVVSQTADETVPQALAYSNVPNGYSPNGGNVTYYTADGTFVPLALWTLPVATQYMAMPSGAYQSGDYYEFSVEASNPSGSESTSIVRYTTSGDPQTFNFPASFLYAGPAAAALPTFNFTYSGFNGMPNVSQQAAIFWGVGTWPGGGIAADLDSITMSATAHYQNGSPTMTVPDLSSLTGFLAPASTGTTVVWTAGFSQGDPFLASTPSGSIQSVSNSGSFTAP
jgi:hypothetical protein